MAQANREAVKFQSTLPREERRVWRGGSCRGSRDFNPRSHERSDVLEESLVKQYTQFQSTLPREERRG